MDKEERLRFNEYLSEHPEERVEVEKLLLRSEAVDRDRRRRASERLSLIREYRQQQRELWGGKWNE